MAQPELNRVRYDHRRHAGNKADRWKHKLLLELVSRLINLQPRNRRFFYAETHAGAGRYVPSSRHGQRQDQGDYSGSWWRVARLVDDHQRVVSFELADLYSRRSMATKQRLRRQTVRWRPVDGFRKTPAQNKPFSLSFVDPPFWPEPTQDEQRVRRYAVTSTQALLIWYPVLSDPLDVLAWVPQGRRFQRLEWHWSSLSSSGMRGCGFVLIWPRVGRFCGFSWRRARRGVVRSPR